MRYIHFYIIGRYMAFCSKSDLFHAQKHTSKHEYIFLWTMVILLLISSRNSNVIFINCNRWNFDNYYKGPVFYIIFKAYDIGAADLMTEFLCCSSVILKDILAKRKTKTKISTSHICLACLDKNSIRLKDNNILSIVMRIGKY